jgi:type VI secretion system protein
MTLTSHGRTGLGRLLAGASLAFVLVLLGGCSAIGGMLQSAWSATAGAFGGAARPAVPEWTSIVLLAGDDANQNSPVAVDLVLVGDQALIDTLITMPASRWFAGRADLLRTFPGALTVRSHEVVPGQSLRLGESAWAGRKSLAAFVFADYLVPGEHRERLSLTGAGHVIQLGARGFRVTEVRAP